VITYSVGQYDWSTVARSRGRGLTLARSACGSCARGRD